ncbi:hypothetical protein [Adhaeretor mobilis]|uniref:Zinc-finger domain-containing protein n=1 Tax=Adhaeretor mobilis TaxID=1930276 RepID=A0A517MQF6_9BACT|nr:hypothetical protein [Adhaeretor mobilis]QDS97120.1 hypothetical protein HG15A2_03800 [Adhaeretor mobilis]
MALSRKQLDTLLGMLSLTRPDEIACDECTEKLSQFAENSLAGKTVPEGLEAVEHHLAICTECCEEFEALMHVLRDSQ